MPSSLISAWGAYNKKIGWFVFQKLLHILSILSFSKIKPVAQIKRPSFKTHVLGLSGESWGAENFCHQEPFPVRIRGFAGLSNLCINLPNIANGQALTWTNGFLRDEKEVSSDFLGSREQQSMILIFPFMFLNFMIKQNMASI